MNDENIRDLFINPAFQLIPLEKLFSARNKCDEVKSDERELF